MEEVIAGLLEGPRRDPGQSRVIGEGQVGPELDLIDVEEDAPHHGVGEIAIGLLHEEEVEELALRPPHGVVVLAAPFPFQAPRRARMSSACHPEVIEGDVAQGDVLLELGGSGNPFTEPLGQDQVVVGVGDQGLNRARWVGIRRTLGSRGQDRLAHM